MNRIMIAVALVAFATLTGCNVNKPPDEGPWSGTGWWRTPPDSQGDVYECLWWRGTSGRGALWCKPEPVAVKP